jgi:hypothetical protein
MPLGYATAIGWLAAVIMLLLAGAVYLLLGRNVENV